MSECPFIQMSVLGPVAFGQGRQLGHFRSIVIILHVFSYVLLLDKILTTIVETGVKFHAC